MLRLERVWEDRNRTPILVISGALVLLVAAVDWWTRPYVSLGFLYLFPIMLAAGFLPRSAVACLGVSCAILAEAFSSLEASFTRLSLETLALSGCGLFVVELVRNRRMTIEAQARLQALVETSPAAIVTVDQGGFIELANQAALQLLAPRDGRLIGTPLYVGRKLRSSGRRCSARGIAAAVKRLPRMSGSQHIRKAPTRN
jgi:PAS domain-containing protein